MNKLSSNKLKFIIKQIIKESLRDPPSPEGLLMIGPSKKYIGPDKVKQIVDAEYADRETAYFDLTPSATNSFANEIKPKLNDLVNNLLTIARQNASENFVFDKPTIISIIRQFIDNLDPFQNLQRPKDKPVLRAVGLDKAKASAKNETKARFIEEFFAGSTIDNILERWTADINTNKFVEDLIYQLLSSLFLAIREPMEKQPFYSLFHKESGFFDWMK